MARRVGQPAAKKQILYDAIAEMCIECMGREEYKDNIRHCTSYNCPIRPHRPYQNDIMEDEDDES